MSAISHYQNQLQFNLLSQPSHQYQGIAVRHQPPKAITVEKLSSSPPKRPPLLTTTTPPQPAFQFSVVSEDKLSLAIRLAQRDLKKKKLEERLMKNEISQQDEKVLKHVKSGKEYKENKRRRKDRDSRISERRIKEQVQTGIKHARKTQTPVKGPSKTSRGLKSRPHLILPAKMTETLTANDPEPSPNSKHVKEISRLQQDLNKYMEQIKHIEEMSHTGVQQINEELEPNEVTRKTAKRQQQVSRSSRMMYMLQQQVKNVQEEMRQLGPGKIKHTKKSETLNRLAAAHRGAIRAIQTFITQLPEQDVRHGLPLAYQELSLLIRQLSRCCAELEVGQQPGDSTMDVLIHDSEVEKATQREIPKAFKTKETSPVRRELFNHQDGLTVDRLRKQRHAHFTRDIGASPEREFAVRAGLEALQKERSELFRYEEDRPVTQDAGKRSMAWDIPVHQQRQPKPVKKTHVSVVKKSVLFPPKLKSQRERVQKPIHPALKNFSRFHEQTHSSKAKVVETPHKYVPPAIRKVRSSPPRLYHNISRECEPDSDVEGPLSERSRSPHQDEYSQHSSRTRSYSQHSPRNKSHIPGMGRIYPKDQFTEQEIARQVWLERHADRTRRELDDMRLDNQRRLFDKRNKDREVTDLIQVAEKEINQRLKPLLDEAKKISEKHEDTKRTTTRSLRQQLSQNASEKVQANANVIADMILSDLLLDATDDINGLKVEQEEQTWNETDAKPEEEVFPKEFIINDDRDLISNHKTKSRIHKPEHDATQAILFTKYPPPAKPAPEEHVPEYKQRMHIPDHVLDNVQDYREAFNRHLRKISHQSVGKFDPWKLVEELADEIVDKCLLDVANELQDTCDEVVFHVYASEFTSPRGAESQTIAQVAKSRSQETTTIDMPPLRIKSSNFNLFESHQQQQETVELSQISPGDAVIDKSKTNSSHSSIKSGNTIESMNSINSHSKIGKNDIISDHKSIDGSVNNDINNIEMDENVSLESIRSENAIESDIQTQSEINKSITSNKTIESDKSVDSNDGDSYSTDFSDSNLT